MTHAEKRRLKRAIKQAVYALVTLLTILEEGEEE